MIKLSILCLLVLISSDCISRSEARRKKASHGNVDVLKILPGINNPRNSEGDFIILKDGRTLYIFTHYTGI